MILIDGTGLIFVIEKIGGIYRRTVMSRLRGDQIIIMCICFGPIDLRQDDFRHTQSMVANSQDIIPNADTKYMPAIENITDQSDLMLSAITYFWMSARSIS